MNWNTKISMDYGHPRYIDRLAGKYPNLKIIAGHEIGSQILMAKDFLPSVKFYILSRGLPENPPKNFLRMEDLLENRYEDYNERLEKRIKAVEPEDAFLIIYTGGTTGNLREQFSLKRVVSLCL